MGPTRSWANIVPSAVFVVTMSAVSACAADVEQGKQFARRACLVCHAATGKQAGSDPNAPSFSAVARSKQFRAKGAKLLWEKHPKMPNFALTGEEAENVSAYIRSLAK